LRKLQVLLLPQASWSKKLPNEIWLSLFLPKKVEKSGLNPLPQGICKFPPLEGNLFEKVTQGLHPFFHPSMKKNENLAKESNF
jgi:hypothetical protein